jgi:hypothetical protein
MLLTGTNFVRIDTDFSDRTRTGKAIPSICVFLTRNALVETSPSRSVEKTLAFQIPPQLVTALLSASG